MNKVSCVLITTHSEYPSEILNSLPTFGEIIIRHPDSIQGRYDGVREAQFDTIYTQDDDCLVDVEQLWSHYRGRITNYMKPHNVSYYKGLCDNRITLMGWGAFFPKSFVNVFDHWTARYGKDHHYYRQADRIFTYLNAPHDTIAIPAIQHLPWYSAKERESQHPKHYEYLYDVLVKLRKLEGIHDRSQ